MFPSLARHWARSLPGRVIPDEHPARDIYYIYIRPSMPIARPPTGTRRPRDFGTGRDFSLSCCGASACAYSIPPATPFPLPCSDNPPPPSRQGGSLVNTANGQTDGHVDCESRLMPRCKSVVFGHGVWALGVPRSAVGAGVPERRLRLQAQRECVDGRTGSAIRNI